MDAVQSQPKFFKTHDFYQAAFCLFIGLDINGQETQGTRTIIHFKKSPSQVDRICISSQKIADTLQEILIISGDEEITNDLKLDKIKRLAGREVESNLIDPKEKSAHELGMAYYRSDAKQLLDCYRSIKDFAYKEKGSSY